MTDQDMKSLALSGRSSARLSRVCSGVAAASLALAFAGAVACGSERSGVSGPKLPQGSRTEALEHEECSESGRRVEVLDTNNDGKPDIRRVFDGSGHERCRIADLNHDGRPDLYEYFDGNGAIRRREFCYDDTGVVNAVETYEGGKLAMREYDTTGQHRIDTWDWFDPGAPPDPKTGRPAHPVRRERDTTGDGLVDQWWTWEGSKVSIATDHDGDGKPDPASVIVLGGGNDDAGAPSGPPGSPAPASSSPGDAGAAADGPLGPPRAAPAATASTAGADGGKP
jgi:hypothetical protein